MIQMTPTDLVEMICEIVNLDSPDEHETMHFVDEYDTEDELRPLYDDVKTLDMDFADALTMLQTGWTVARRAWHPTRSISFAGLNNPIHVPDLKASDWYVL